MTTNKAAKYHEKNKQNRRFNICFIQHVPPDCRYFERQHSNKLYLDANDTVEVSII